MTAPRVSAQTSPQPEAARTAALTPATPTRARWAIGLLAGVLLLAAVWYLLARRQEAQSAADTPDTVATHTAAVPTAVPTATDASGPAAAPQVDARTAPALTPAAAAGADLLAASQLGWNISRDSQDAKTVIVAIDNPVNCAQACRDSGTCVVWWLEMSGRDAPAVCHVAGDAGNPVASPGILSGQIGALIPQWAWNYRIVGEPMQVAAIPDPMQCNSLCAQTAGCYAWDYRKPVCGSPAVPACTLYSSGESAYDTCYVAGP